MDSRIRGNGAFETCPGFTSRYALQGCSAAQGGLCHKASARSVARPSRLSATRFTDNYLGGTFTHQRSAPLGRTELTGVILCRFHFVAQRPQHAYDGVAPRNRTLRLAANPRPTSRNAVTATGVPKPAVPSSNAPKQKATRIA